MSEQGQRRRVIRELRPLDAVSVENTAYPGTPDVNFREGWLELKWLRRWPTRPDTIVRIHHFTQQQRVWLKRRWRRGGVACLLLQCQTTWLLFDGDTAADHVGRTTKSQLQQLSLRQWGSGLRKGELAECLQSLCRERSGC